MFVEVRPLPRKPWHEKTGKESFSQPKVIEVLYDIDKGEYATGLSDEEVKKYGKLLGVDLSNKFTFGEDHTYWGSKPAQIKLENFTTIFNTVKPVDFVKVKNMKASKYIANSLKEWEQGLYPEATHVIFDEEAEVEVKATKVAQKQKAAVITSKMSKEEKIQIIQILSSKTVKGRSDSFIDVEIDNIIENNVGDFLTYSKMDKEDVTVRASVLEALSKNILTKEAGAIYYMGELVGIDYEGAVEWFKDPNNQKIKVSILEKLNK